MGNQDERESIVSNWSIVGTPDPQTVNSNWLPTNPCPIDGVVVKEIRSVPVATGTMTECFRSDWELHGKLVNHVFQRLLEPGSISAWHAHAVATDGLFCAFGRIRLALYDARKDSPSFDATWNRVFGVDRPLMVIVPAGVWHGVQVVSSQCAILLNIADVPYDYEAPDHWRLPPDTDAIPYEFPT